MGKSAATSEDSGESSEKTAKTETTENATKEAPKEEKPAPKPEGKPAPKKDDKKDEKPAPAKADPIVGDYIIKGYEGNKNNWHYVKISVVDADKGIFRWTNKAGVKWTLTKKSDTKFAVGTDCPYYRTGHKEATLKLNDEGKVVSIAGPWNEIYMK